MALIKSVRGFTPEIGENCFLADNATLVGDVKMGRDRVARRRQLHPHRQRCEHTGRQRAAHALREIDHRDRRPRVHRPQRHHPRRHRERLCPHRHGRHAAGPRRGGRRRHRGRRFTGAEQHGHRAGQHLGRRTRQVHQEGGPRTGQGAEPEDSAQLPDVRRLVQGMTTPYGMTG